MPTPTAKSLEPRRVIGLESVRRASHWPGRSRRWWEIMRSQKSRRLRWPTHIFTIRQRGCILQPVTQKVQGDAAFGCEYRARRLSIRRILAQQHDSFGLQTDIPREWTFLERHPFLSGDFRLEMMMGDGSFRHEKFQIERHSERPLDHADQFAGKCIRCASHVRKRQMMGSNAEKVHVFRNRRAHMQWATPIQGFNFISRLQPGAREILAAGHLRHRERARMAKNLFFRAQSDFFALRNDDDLFRDSISFFKIVSDIKRNASKG